MEQMRLAISDAADLVAVESHVLRYWEEELDLVIPRNELGHRYYTKENIDEFVKIKELKEKGYQLKAIRSILKTGQASEPEVHMGYTEEPRATTLTVRPNQVETAVSAKERMEQFQELMTRIVKNAVVENSKAFSKDIGEEVGDRILKEMNYLMRENEEREEERYRKIDDAIRSLYKTKSKRFRIKKETVS